MGSTSLCPSKRLVWPPSSGSETSFTAPAAAGSRCESSKRVHTGESSETHVSILAFTSDPTSTLELVVSQAFLSERFGIFVLRTDPSRPFDRRETCLRTRMQQPCPNPGKTCEGDPDLQN